MDATDFFDIQNVLFSYPYALDAGDFAGFRQRFAADRARGVS